MKTEWTTEAVTQTKSLFISAGHSYKDPGAYGNGYTEADIVLSFRDAVANALRGKVTFTKDGDHGENLPLSEAIQLAKVRDVAVEFHCNAFKDPRATGVEVLCGPEDTALSERLSHAIALELGIEDRGAKPEGAGAHSRLGFISKGGGIIVELFFLTNENDLKAYQRSRDRLAYRVADELIKAVSQ